MIKVSRYKLVLRIDFDMAWINGLQRYRISRNLWKEVGPIDRNCKRASSSRALATGELSIIQVIRLNTIDITTIYLYVSPVFGCF
jgi:hypothetical protein